MSIADKLVTIAENEPKVFHAGRIKPLADAESLNGKLQGAAVAANDVINIEHNVPCRVESKNLFEFKQGFVSGGTGSVIESLDNGAICQGVVYDNKQHNSWGNGWYSFENRATVNVKAGDTVTISCDYTVLELADGRSMNDFNETLKKVGIHFYSNNGGKNVSGVSKTQPTVLGEPTRLYITYTIAADGDYHPVFTLNSNKVKIENIQIEYGSTPTPYTPYITDFSGVEVKRYGKNLVDLYGYSASSISNPTATRELVNTTYGTTVSTIEPENSVTVTQSKIGNETDVQHYSNGYICVGFYNDIPENTVVTFSFEVDITNNPLNATSIGVMCNGAFSFNKATQINNRWVSTGTYKNNGDRRYIEIRNSGISGTFSNFQLELGNTATDYEPYNGITYQSTAEGIVNGVTSIAPNMTLLTNAEGVIINANYYKDPDIVISNLQQAVAMSGGE